MGYPIRHFKLKKIKEFILRFGYFFLGLLRTLRAPTKKIRSGTPFSGYPGTPKHCPFLNYPICHFKLKKSKSVSLDLADFFFRDPKGSHKKNQIRNAIFRVPRYPQTLPVFELSD